MRFIARRAGAAAAGATALVLLLSAAWVFRQAETVRRRAASQIAAAGDCAFTSRVLNRPTPAGFETYDISSGLTDAVFFQSELFVSTPPALLEYDSAGELQNRFRPGAELPPGVLGALAVGRAGDSSGQELFIGTDGAGLLVFDGRRFRQVLPADPALSRITALLALPAGRLLWGTRASGVLVYDGKHLRPFHAALAGLPITALGGDVGAMWAGTLDRGLYHWHAGQVEHWDQQLPDRQVLSLDVSAAAVYAGTPVGVAVFRDGRLHRTLADGVFASALLARGGVLAVGSQDQGILDLAPGGRPVRPASVPSAAVARGVHKLLAAGDMEYAVTEAGLLARSRPGEPWRAVLGRQSGRLTDRNVSALAIDTAGRLWIGYFDRGLDILDGDRVTHLEDDRLFCINRISAGAQTTAVATANGLVLFDAAARQRQVLRQSEGLLADHVTDVLLRPDGMIAATPAGITTIDASGTHSVSDFHGLVNPHVYALATRGDTVMAGTLGGISVLERGVVRQSYTTANSGLRHNWITALAPVGNEWFAGTYGEGVVRLTAAGDWEAFPDLRTRAIVNPNAMLVTDRAVYTGTLGQGLLAYDRAAGRWSAVTTGLPSLNVTALASGGPYLYIGTDNGLVRVAEQDLP